MIGAARTAIGKLGGALAAMSAVELGKAAVMDGIGISRAMTPTGCAHDLQFTIRSCGVMWPTKIRR